MGRRAIEERHRAFRIKKSAIKKLGIAPYDTAEYLKTEEDVAAYLEACIEEAGDDPIFIAQALGTIARAKGTIEVVQGEDMGMRSLLRADIMPVPGSSIRVSGSARVMPS